MGTFKLKKENRRRRETHCPTCDKPLRVVARERGARVAVCEPCNVAVTTLGRWPE